MIGIEARWFGHPVTKPGHGEPEPLKPVYTYDPPEIMAVCLDCPVAGGCDKRSEMCPLDRKSARRHDLDDKICRLIRAGWRNSDAICEELGISKWTLSTAKKRLRERGEIN